MWRVFFERSPKIKYFDKHFLVLVLSAWALAASLLGLASGWAERSGRAGAVPAHQEPAGTHACRCPWRVCLDLPILWLSGEQPGSCHGLRASPGWAGTGDVTGLTPAMRLLSLL